MARDKLDRDSARRTDLGGLGGARDWWKVRNLSDDLLDLANSSYYRFLERIDGAVPVSLPK